MNKTARLGLILTITEKYWVKRLAELEGGLSQAALVRRLVREAAQKHNINSTTTINVSNESKGVIDE